MGNIISFFFKEPLKEALFFVLNQVHRMIHACGVILKLPQGRIMKNQLIKPIIIGVATLAAWEFVVRPSLNSLIKGSSQ